MKECAVCGNIYDKPIEITYNGRKEAYDCFECAIHALAPLCAKCGITIIGHGIEKDNHIFCCDHCGRTFKQTSMYDTHEEMVF